MDRLPIDARVEEIVGLVRRHRALVVTAAPGAGKTTRVPPALIGDGPVVLLQPRRVAARAIARRIADERGWSVGREVGWHVRHDRNSSRETRLLVVTEGILTSRLQHDPLISDVTTVVIDEFHERSVHADLGLALARQAWLARGDLRIVVMSATLETGPVSDFLGGCPIVDVPGRLFPLDISYQPGTRVDEAVAGLLRRRELEAARTVLCFLPGAPEIRKSQDALRSAAGGAGVDVLPLHGSLTAEEQDAAIEPSSRPRVILATNLAETTLTVPGVTCVVDTGLHKVARYDAARAIDSLELERVSQDSAEQRAGRAGRLAPGRVVRLWDERDRLRRHREPEIARVDLAGPVLDVLVWGGDPRTFEWFERPDAPALDGAIDLLVRLGAVDPAGRLTPLGRSVQRLPLHPRLATLLLAAGGAREAALGCALMSERAFVPPRTHATSCDLLAAVEDAALPSHITRTGAYIRDNARAVLGPALVEHVDEERFRRAILAGFPDRVAKRRAARGDRLLLASGRGARLARESGVHDAEFLVALDVTAITNAPGGEPIVRMASAVDASWLQPTTVDVVHELDQTSGRVRARRLARYGQLVLAEHAVPPDPARAATIVAEEYVRRGPSDEDIHLLRRLEFAGVAMSFDDLVRAAAAGATRLDEVALDAHVPFEVRRALDRDAPRTITLPNGRELRLEYRENGVFAAVKLQHLFGVRETPTIGRRQTPLTFELLAPNGRPVQVTSDLTSFWARGYPEVRKELRGRYPKHAWPEDPLTWKTMRR